MKEQLLEDISILIERLAAARGLIAPEVTSGGERAEKDGRESHQIRRKAPSVRAQGPLQSQAQLYDRGGNRKS